jgi:hypothetical protein
VISPQFECQLSFNLMKLLIERRIDPRSLRLTALFRGNWKNVQITIKPKADDLNKTDDLKTPGYSLHRGSITE